MPLQTCAQCTPVDLYQRWLSLGGVRTAPQGQSGDGGGGKDEWLKNRAAEARVSFDDETDAGTVAESASNGRADFADEDSNDGDNGGGGGGGGVSEEDDEHIAFSNTGADDGDADEDDLDNYFKSQKDKAATLRIMVIDGNTKTKLGVFPMEKALSMAKKAGNTLVCVSKKASPHVYRMISVEQAHADIAQQKQFERDKQNKLKAESRAERKKARTDAKNTKELKMTAMASDHDKNTKLKSARKFLKKGLRVKFTLFYRRNQPRDMVAQEAFMQSLIDGLEDEGKEVENSSFRHGGGASLSTTLEPL